MKNPQHEGSSDTTPAAGETAASAANCPWPGFPGAGPAGVFGGRQGWCCRDLKGGLPTPPWLPWTAGAGWPPYLAPMPPEVAKRVELEVLSAQAVQLEQYLETIRKRIRALGGHDPASLAGLP